MILWIFHISDSILGWLRQLFQIKLAFFWFDFVLKSTTSSCLWSLLYVPQCSGHGQLTLGRATSTCTSTSDTAWALPLIPRASSPTHAMTTMHGSMKGRWTRSVLPPPFQMQQPDFHLDMCKCPVQRHNTQWDHHQPGNSEGHRLSLWSFRQPILRHPRRLLKGLNSRHWSAGLHCAHTPFCYLFLFPSLVHSLQSPVLLLGMQAEVSGSASGGKAG